MVKAFLYYYAITDTETIRTIRNTKNYQSALSSTAIKITKSATRDSCQREKPQRLYQHFVLLDFLHLLEYRSEFFDN